VIFIRASTISTGSAAVFDSTFARCHGSRLLTFRLLLITTGGVVFNIAVNSEVFHAACPACVVFPMRMLHLSRLSAYLLWLTAFLRSRQSHPSVLMHSSNRLPSG